MTVAAPPTVYGTISRTARTRLEWEGFALFVIGLSSAVHISLVGTLYATDLVNISLLPFLLTGRHTLGTVRGARWLFCLLAAWLFGAVVTDLVRHTSPENYLRGWARIAFFGASISVVLLLSRLQIRRLFWYFLGLTAATAIGALLEPTPFQAGDPWKFGYAPLVAILCVGLASLALKHRRTSTVRRILPPTVAAVANLVFNYRSLFLILMASTALTGASRPLARWVGRNPAYKPVLAIGFWGAIALATFGGGGLYGSAASSGILGQGAKDKYYEQVGHDVGLLLGGRSEFLASSQAILDSPLLGHGSWAADRYYVALRIMKLRERGVEVRGNPFVSDLIPSHSYLTGSWIEAGILGAAFWAYCFFLAIRASSTIAFVDVWQTPFVAYLCVQLLWSILFSPFGAEVRFTVAGELCAMLWAIGGSAAPLANEISRSRKN